MRIGTSFGRHCMNDFGDTICDMKSTEIKISGFLIKIQNKFGGFNYLLYLCIGNKEIII